MTTLLDNDMHIMPAMQQSKGTKTELQSFMLTLCQELSRQRKTYELCSKRRNFVCIQSCNRNRASL